MAEADQQRFAGHIQRQTERLQHLIDQLLGLAAVEQMRRLAVREPVDLVALTHELLHSAEARMQLKGLTAQVDTTANAVVLGDRFLIGQALQNLLDNAVEFSPPGGELTVCALVDADDGSVVWSVRDQGPGVPDYAINRVFDRFYSLPRGEHQDRSSGLGLCLVKEVVELHGGSVTLVNAEAPRGCIATLRWPRSG